LYKEAREDMDSGSYERAIKGWNAWKAWAPARCWPSSRSWTWPTCTGANEKAQALSTIERFIKYNPSSPALDYALYLRGVINFNDNLGLLGNLAGQDLSERDQRASRDCLPGLQAAASTSSRPRATRPMHGCAWTTSSTRWRPTKCTWRATTSAAAPTWPRPTAPSRR
jgi:hypothetical protein